VAIAGFFLECNRWSPVTTPAMFEQSVDLAGDALAAQLRGERPRLLPDTIGFVAAMDEAGPWVPVPTRVAGAQPGGPAEQPWFEALVGDIESRLRAAMPLDGVFITSHGAALTTALEDPDGELFSRIRAVVGPDVPVVAVLDLHANVTQKMTDALSALVAYRTNPHQDLRERGEEAAALMRRFLLEGPGCVALRKLPLVAPSTSQLIAPGTVYAQLIEAGQAALDAQVLNVSLFGGFALADSTTCGFAVAVTARQGARERAEQVAAQLAQRVWDERHRFVSRLVPLEQAVAQAVRAGLEGGPALILADVADNPGGGAGGNTVDLLRALLQAGAQGVLLGVFTDAALARQAHAEGLGAQFEAVFNRMQHDALPGTAGATTAFPGATRFTWQARVVALSDGRFLGRRGLVAGTQRDMGPSALLDLGGVRVAVISQRQQLLDPAQLDVLGVELATVRTLVVKSRGHFRAAFEGFAPPERILEVDCPGLTTPNLRTLAWRRLPRPIYPLDDDATWDVSAG
jgi:microcystin degradation protein MlrC